MTQLVTKLYKITEIHSALTVGAMPSYSRWRLNAPTANANLHKKKLSMAKVTRITATKYLDALVNLGVLSKHKKEKNYYTSRGIHK
jgi:hypothetical protein